MSPTHMGVMDSADRILRRVLSISTEKRSDRRKRVLARHVLFNFHCARRVQSEIFENILIHFYILLTNKIPAYGIQ